MKSARLYNLLTRALRPNDNDSDNGLTLGDDDLSAAVVSALLAYSQYRPALRRIGNGVLLDAAPAGANTLIALGGVWRVGQILHLDTFGYAAPETVVVQSLADYDRGGADVLTCVQVTLTAPLQTDHAPGAVIVPDVPGLVLVPGVDTYALPSDWIGVDQDSFDLATGARSASGRQAGFYDGAYSQSQQLSGLGYGQRADFGSGFGQNAVGPIGLFGLPANAGSGQTRYMFVDDAPARLIVSPAPGASRLLDFVYQGCHSVETVPNADGEALVAYAAYSALSAQAAQVARQEDKMAGDERAIYSKSRESLTMQAQACLDRFHRLIVNRPYASGG